jgi:hypothetical protein
MILAAQPVVEIQMRHVPADKHKVTFRICRNMPPNMPDTRIRFNIYQLHLRMIVPEEFIPQPRGKYFEGFPRIEPDLL